MRGRCSKPTRHIFVRALASVACFSICFSGLLLASNVGWTGSSPQVVLAAGGSSGGGGADDSSWDALVKRVDKIVQRLNTIDGQLGELYSLSANAFRQIRKVQDAVGAINGQLGELYSLSANAFSQIRDEVTNRQISVDHETVARQSADSSLQAQINTVNQTSLPSLQGQINSVVKGSIPGLMDRINTITQTSLPSLQGQITAISQGSIPGLQKQLNTVLDTSLPSLQGQITAISQGSVPSLQKQVSDETSDRIKAIDNETAARQVADKSLQAQITSEVSDRTKGDSNEMVARQAADSSLQAQIISLSADVSDAVGSAAVVHSVDVVRDKVEYLTTGTDSPLVLIKNFVRDIDTLLDGTLQKILDKLTSIDNRAGGEKPFWLGQVQLLIDAINSMRDNESQYLSSLYDLMLKFRTDFTKSFPSTILTLQQEVHDSLQNVVKTLLVVRDNESQYFDSLFALLLKFRTDFINSFPSTILNLQQEVHDSLKSVISAINGIKIPDIPDNSDPAGGGSIWDFLKALVQAVASIVKAISEIVGKLLEMLMQVFVPKDMSFITDSFEGISSKFDKKFAIFIDFGSSLKGLFSSRHVLKDFSLSFAGASVVVPLSVVSTLAGQMRPLLTGLFVLLTVTGVYRRFTDGEVVS
ncbi:Hypothetical protein LCAKO_1p05 (plasmid) [Lacticaseibacillus paracasei subsp. paracasei]|uniref:Uncharacterized protein n=1 Tax=Lacticaseibacillus paracasei subsp. paracasei TaxID=47714 RepID=A0AAP9HL69_LACPA|nr:hypothetical protein [Lacticaseibacillus paracasei]QGV19707.1 Hypothetical protein LCAKO_1p05 [Lacticaseibacillus paracasei subsp. paracasei]